jgi:M6 family metalloprotease-like protein
MSKHTPSAPRRRATAMTAAVTTALVSGLVVTSLAALPSGPATAAAAAAAPSAPSAPAVSRVSVGGLEVENSFVSSVGWVKPGDTYPSRIIVTNPTDAPVAGAAVTVTAPTGSTITEAGSGAVVSGGGTTATWAVPTVTAGGTRTLVLESVADTTEQNPEIVWRDISTTAEITVGAATEDATSHGPKVIPPSDTYDTARYGDRLFPVVPVQYRDRAYQAGHDGDSLESVINDPANPGSTYNLYQEMSLGQLFPEGTVPSAGIASKDFTYGPGFDFTQLQLGQTCTGGATITQTDLGDVPAPGTVGGAGYDERITDGVYNLPGNTAYYGADANGSAVIGSLAGVGALQNIDSGCGSAGKMVYDAAAIADPEIDYSDYDTDKDGVVDFFMAVFAGCGGNGSSQLSVAGCDYTGLPYDNVWPHSSSLEYYYSDPVTGLAGYTTDDQLKDLEGRPLWYTDDSYTDKTTDDMGDALKVFVRVGPYNVNPETAIDKASVISHEYGHSLGLPDFYSTGSRETYGDWNLMATDKSQNMDAFSRQELGWVVPQVLDGSRTVTGITDSKQDTGTITWQRPDGTPYTLTNGPDGTVHNSEMFVAKLPGRQLLDPATFDTGDTATKSHAWWSGSGNDFGCSPTGGHNLDLSIPQLASLPEGSTVNLSFKSNWDIEWDFDYGFVLTTTDGGETYTSHASDNGYTTSNTDPLAGNPNQNTCQATYDNGLTGTSGSYAAGTQVTDRKLGNTPAGVFVEDSYDISDLAGAANGALRFSYATDPGLARPGWFIDDVKVTATTPSGDQVLLDTDFETDGGPDDARVFNGGCREDLTTAQRCTQGWKYLQAGAESPQDHAYYLELRDRSGFDLDGHGQIDRDPIGWEAGLYLAYTDEAHGYGNAGTDDPPAQSPLDSTPEPGSATPDLNDAAFTTATGRSSYSDSSASPHVDNYADPGSASGNWEFGYDCLDFDVQSMTGNSDGPSTSDGDLTGSVAFTMGAGCGAFDYGYTDVSAPANTAPTADAAATPTRATTTTRVTLSGVGSTDEETPGSLDYTWDFGDGGTTKDATGPVVRHTFGKAGSYDVTLLVTDPSGATDTDEVTVTVTKATTPTTTPTTVSCGSSQVRKTGSWRVVKAKRAPGGSYCDNLGKRKGKDTLRLGFRGPQLDVYYGQAAKGGRAALYVDDERVGTLSFAGKGAKPSFSGHRTLTKLGTGKHTVRLVVLKGRAYVDRFRS